MVNKLTKAEIHKLEEEKLEKLKEITWENRMDDRNIVAFDLKELPHSEDDWDDFVDSLDIETVLLITATAILSNNPDAETILFQDKLQELLLAHIDALYNIYWRDERVENILYPLKGNKKH